MDELFQHNDHDLLIAISTQMNDLRREVKELKDGTLTRIVNLEREKADRKEIEELQIKVNKDIEVRVRALENANATDIGSKSGIGISWGVVVTVVGIVISIIAIIVGVKYF